MKSTEKERLLIEYLTDLREGAVDKDPPKGLDSELAQAAKRLTMNWHMGDPSHEQLEAMRRRVLTRACAEKTEAGYKIADATTGYPVQSILRETAQPMRHVSPLPRRLFAMDKHDLLSAVSFAVNVATFVLVLIIFLRLLGGSIIVLENTSASSISAPKLPASATPSTHQYHIPVSNLSQNAKGANESMFSIFAGSEKSMTQVLAALTSHHPSAVPNQTDVLALMSCTIQTTGPTSRGGHLAMVCDSSQVADMGESRVFIDALTVNADQRQTGIRVTLAPPSDSGQQVGASAAVPDLTGGLTRHDPKLLETESSNLVHWAEQFVHQPIFVTYVTSSGSWGVAFAGILPSIGINALVENQVSP